MRTKITAATAAILLTVACIAAEPPASPAPTQTPPPPPTQVAPLLAHETRILEQETQELKQEQEFIEQTAKNAYRYSTIKAKEFYAAQIVYWEENNQLILKNNIAKFAETITTLEHELLHATIKQRKNYALCNDTNNHKFCRINKEYDSIITQYNLAITRYKIALQCEELSAAQGEWQRRPDPHPKCPISASERTLPEQ